MDNGVRYIVEKYIPYCLHGSTSSLDVVLKWFILPSNIHHESWNKSVTPDMTIDPLRKVPILEFFAATGFSHLGFLFDNECLVWILGR